MAQHPLLAIKYAQRSDTGLQRRLNEDTSIVHEMTLPDKRQAIIAAVADGMGGAQAGAEASRLAVSSAVQTLAARLETTTPVSEQQWQELLCEALHTANKAVHARSHTTRRLNGMGTTLLLSVLYERRVRIAHIGDCRAYVVRPAARKPHIIQLTADHTVVAELIGRGAISHADATSHPQRHQLARSLGPEPQIEPELTARNLRTGERLLLCSDGLPLHVTDNELARMISDSPTPQIACDRLVELANQRGGRDNVTVVIIAADRDGR
jgi:protein phosphatase